ncbi:hypothetical protein BURMUCF1_1055 [Burkholderia multivorans ATCC BAA-247]|nr:hypothetical protein BURMUCF1_1055 [Burkholderia multivorans ATCC BAA-247]
MGRGGVGRTVGRSDGHGCTGRKERVAARAALADARSRTSIEGADHTGAPQIVPARAGGPIGREGAL